MCQQHERFISYFSFQFKDNKYDFNRINSKKERLGALSCRIKKIAHPDFSIR